MECENLNLRHVRAFCEVGRSGSITAATRHVFLSQSAITQAIANLERIFEVPMFTRKNSGMVLTEPGRFFFERAKRALENIRLGAQRAQRGNERLDARKFTAFEHSVTSAQLRSLLAIDRSGNFSLAARREGISQPSLYRAARDLERISGMSLFISNSRGVELTPAATTFARFVRLAFAELNQGYDEISAWRGRDTSRISIGTLPLSRYYVLAQAIEELIEQRPDISVRVVDGSYDELLRELREGSLDIMIGGLRHPPPIDDVEQKLLFQDVLSVGARVDHPLAQKKKVTVGDLAEFPWVVSRPGAPVREAFEALFRSGGIRPPKRIIESNSLVLIRDLLVESDRLALVSAHQIEREMDQGLVKILKVDGHDPRSTERSIGTTVRSDWRPTGTQLLLLELLDKAASQLTRTAPHSYVAART